MNLRMSLAALFVLTLFGCSHAPTKESQAELAQIQEQLKAMVVKKLATRPGFKEVTEFKILNVESASKAAKFTYSATYLSELAGSGKVSDTLEGEILLVKTAERQWKITDIKLQAQTVVFHEPMEIIGSSGQ